jgi:7-alpha-hydroxysteroid dehydrogenase
MANGLAGKSAIVTGAAHGVGLAIARRFVRAGAFVTMADIDEDRLEAEVETLSEEGYEGRAAAFAGDLRQKLTMTNLMAATLDATEGVDILVNACRMLQASEPLHPENDCFEETLAQNVVANLRLSQIVARRMIELAKTEEPPADRAILNVSSVYGRRTQPSLLAYSVSCAALDQLTRSLAVVLAPHRIRVNAIAVGGVLGRALGEALGDVDDLHETLTTATPLGRLGEAQEAAEAALFLASASASFTTGHVLDVDGGRLLTETLESGPG